MTQSSQRSQTSTSRLVGFAAISVLLALALTIGAPFALAVHDGAPPGKPVNLAWHDDQLWNSVVLGPLHGPTPPHTLDAFYTFPDQAPVAGAGPGDPDYNGGRWIPFSCTAAPGTLTDGDQVEAAILAGDIVCTPNAGGPFMGANFLCPLTNRNA
jgi:hypothetical protein